MRRGILTAQTRVQEKRVHRSKNHAWEEQNMRELVQTREAYGPTRKFYQVIASYRNNVVPKVNCYRNKDGDLVSNQPEVLSRWAQYFDELLNDQFNEQLAPLADSVMLLPPSIEETRKIIRRLKNSKAPGTDRIVAELVKNGDAQLENEIHQIVTEVWDSGSMHCDWKLGIIYLSRQQLQGYYGVEYRL